MNSKVRFWRTLPSIAQIKIAKPTLRVLINHPQNVRGEINFWNVFSDLRKLGSIHIASGENQRNALSHSIAIFNQALQLTQDKSFSYDPFARDGYEKFLHSKTDTDSQYTNRDLIALAALLHNIGLSRTYEGHEHSGAQLALDVSAQLGLSRKEAEYASFLVRNQGIPSHMIPIFEEEDIIRYHKSTDFDLGLPLLALAMSKAENPEKEGIARHILDYPFNLHPLETVFSGRSILAQLEMASPLFRTIFTMFNYTSVNTAFREFNDFVRIDHLLSLDKQIEAATQMLKGMPEDPNRAYYIKHLEKLSSEKSSILSNPERYLDRIRNAANRVVLIPKDNFQDLPWTYDYSKFKDEIPVLLFPFENNENLGPEIFND